jgi:hypothetical protein
VAQSEEGRNQVQEIYIHREKWFLQNLPGIRNKAFV